MRLPIPPSGQEARILSERPVLSNQSPKPSKVRGRDPRFDEESSKYEHPIPSREFIAQTLAEQGVPVSFEELTKLLDVKLFEREAFSRFYKASGLI